MLTYFMFMTPVTANPSMMVTERSLMLRVSVSKHCYTFSTNGNPSIVYGGEDADGLQHIIIDFDATTTWVELCNKGLYYALERDAEINTAISVMMENITEGDLTLNTRFLYYYGAAKTYDGYEDGRTKSLTELLTATYQGISPPLTTSKYVGEQTAMSYIRQDSAHPTQAEYVQAAIVLRGAKGRARIKLPAIWTTKGIGSADISPPLIAVSPLISEGNKKARSKAG